MAPPSINTPVAIDATNSWLDVWDAVGFFQQVQIPAATYDDVPAVCAALQIVLQALAGTWAAATVTVVFDGAVPGMVRIHSNQGAQACSLLWDTGVHGSGGFDTHCGTVLGFTDALGDDDIGAFFYTSDYQHQSGWYATRAIRSYGPLTPHFVGGATRKNLARTRAKTLYVSTGWTYDIALEQIEPWHMFQWLAIGANTNRAFLDGNTWGLMTTGVVFQWREDQEVLGTAIEFYLESPRDLAGKLIRAYPDYECYNLSMRFLMEDA